MAMVGVANGSVQADSQPKLIGLVQGLAQLALSYIHQMN